MERGMKPNMMPISEAMGSRTIGQICASGKGTKERVFQGQIDRTDPVKGQSVWNIDDKSFGVVIGELKAKSDLGPIIVVEMVGGRKHRVSLANFWTEFSYKQSNGGSE